MKLLPDTALCITATLTPPPETLSYLKNLLSPEELERASRFHFEQHQTHFIAARGFMRVTLAHLLACEPRALVFDYTASGKPFLPGQSLTFNLAHSGELALLAINQKHPIGVDIENISDKKIMEIAARYFSLPEQSHLASLPENEKLNAFFDIWAKKEAVVKAIGTGIQQSLASFTVPLIPAAGMITIDNHAWFIRPLSIATGYASALATHPTIQNISLWQWLELHFHEIGQKNTLL